MFRKIIKKLNNFKFTAIVAGIISGVSALYSLGALFLYHFAGDLDAKSRGLIRHVGFSNVENGAMLGMVLFFSALIAFAISAFIVYSLVPFMQNKEKNNPRKGLLLAGFVSAIFEFVLLIFMILLLAKGEPNTKVLIIVTLPIGFASTIASGLYLIPWLKCDFYMPKIEAK